MPTISAPKGTRDILPAQMAAWEWLLDAHRRITAEYGYRGIETPMLEATQLFERGIGAGTDVVDKEMWTFADRGGRSLTLRPEGTPAVLRAVLGSHLDQEGRPVRVRYAGPMFRYDRPQKGRYRQFSQIGVECIGERSPALDVEVVEMAWRFHQALGVTGVSLQINSLGDLDDRRHYRQALVDYYTPLLDALCEDCRRRLGINPLRLLDCKRDASHVTNAPSIRDSLGQPSRAYFDAVLDGLRGAGLPLTVNDRLVRGLDYYAHTTFEFWHKSLQGAQNALGGGGRYDGLAEVLGFPATPGVGYALGVDRLLMVAEELGVAPAAPAAAEVLVCSVDATDGPAAAHAARRLREDGIHVVLDAADRRLDRKLRASDRVGARVAVIIGTDEAAQHRVTVRDVAARTQESVPERALVAAVRRSLTIQREAG